jgi:hypothetical protein
MSASLIVSPSANAVLVVAAATCRAWQLKPGRQKFVVQPPHTVHVWLWLCCGSFAVLVAWPGVI